MPGGRVLARFYWPGNGGFELLFCSGGGNSIRSSKILPWGFAGGGGGWSGLELTDTLATVSKVVDL